MPWRRVSEMDQRLDLVTLMQQQGGPTVKELARRFGVSRKTAYKWLARSRQARQQASVSWALARSGAQNQQQPEVLTDRSRRPAHSPGQCPAATQERIVELRRSHPAWGARKLRQYLIDQQQLVAVPAASTVGRILKRCGLIDEQAWRQHTAFVRFEYPEPNDLWQMDFKGPFATVRQGKCNPLCVLDDHSRYALGVRACGNQEMATVQAELTRLFRTYGLPGGILADNGSSWSKQSKLCVWLMRLGLRVLHGRPAHPQTQGKLERFNRTLAAEGIGVLSFPDLEDCQRRFDAWREEYNHRRPHEALAMAVPASRYRASPRSFPEVLPAIEYGPGDQVLTVNGTGQIGYRGRRWMIGQAYCGLPVGVRPTLTDGLLNVYFCQQKVAEIDLREPGQ